MDCHLSVLLTMVSLGTGTIWDTDRHSFYRERWLHKWVLVDHFSGISQVLSGALRIPGVQRPVPVKQWAGENLKTCSNIWHSTQNQGCSNDPKVTLLDLEVTDFEGACLLSGVWGMAELNWNQLFLANQGREYLEKTSHPKLDSIE